MIFNAANCLFSFGDALFSGGLLLLPFLFFHGDGDSEFGDHETDGGYDSESEDAVMDESESDGGADFELELRKIFEDEEKTRRELLDRVEQNEKRLAAGETGFEKTLAQDYLACALDFQEEDDFEQTTEYLDKAIDLLTEANGKNPSEELTRMLGLARLTYGVVLNDQGMWSEALAEYLMAEELMEGLDAAGNLEARLDLAGIRLNAATIHFELAEYDESLAAFEKVKSDFSSLMGTEKEEEALYYLAKTYLQEAAVYRELNENEKSLRRMEEGIALYRKMAAQGDSEHGLDLAPALADYAHSLECSGEKTPEEILPIVEEAIDRLREGIVMGRTDVCPDLLNVSIMKGRLLNYQGRDIEAEEFLTEAADIFSQLQETDDPSALLNLISLHDERGKARLSRRDLDGALADFSEGIKIGSRLSDPFSAEEPLFLVEEAEMPHHVMKSEGNLTLFSVYVNHAKTLRLLRRDDEAKGDCRIAGQILSSLEEYLEEDYGDYFNLYQTLVKSLGMESD